MRKRLIGICLLLLAGSVYAMARNSFAIIVDAESYSRCRAEIENYSRSVIQDGLDAFIVSGNWESPEQIKDTLRHFHAERNMEGAVLIGDIPIAMIRKAQHMTSAFKMDEDMFPMRESSVPSDRFYDDFDLEFKFIGRDSAQSNLFYYELSPRSPQEIHCDIYTARIRPSSRYRDRYQELSSYLKKVVRIKNSRNRLDQITSYSGDGSFSNSLIAWKDETVTLAEQMPDAFSRNTEARFYIFAMEPFMKESMIQEISRNDLDLVLFHEHGMPERQYLTSIPPATMMEEYYETARLQARNIIRNYVRYGSTEEEAMKKFAEKYGTDSTWYQDTFDAEVTAADSLADLETGITLDDIHQAAPNVKMALFDACYNGDFREEDCIASRYIMSEGDCIVTIGNSANVLQDKSSSDLMGMLSCGYRIGEWMQFINILESHIFGDPTFRFTSSFTGERPDLENSDCSYWLDLLSQETPADLQSLALYRLADLEYPSISGLLLRTYKESPYYMTRLQCMHLLAHYNDGNYKELLTLALNDPYEFIRRKASTFCGHEGSPELAKALAQAYLNDVNSKRIAFDIGMSAGHFPDRSFEKELNEAIDQAEFIMDKELFRKEAEAVYGSAIRMAESSVRSITSDKPAKSGRSIYLSGMRNNPYPFLADELVQLVKKPEKDLKVRIQAAETLGWFVRAWNRSSIYDQLSAYLKSDQNIPEELSDEIYKTLGRLGCFLK